jgi:uncharacterized protein (TIGR01777 family)
MRIAVTGSTGLIGSELVHMLRYQGHEMLRLVRARPTGRHASYWNPETGVIDAEVLGRTDAVVHLAGRSIGGRWTDQVKREILDSRTRSTGLLAGTMARLTGGPRTLVAMSMIAYYGDQGDRILTEDSPTGQGFMAAVARASETAAEPARAAGIRVVHVRGGILQSPKGGILARQLPLFRLGLGGRLGSGRQWWSWVSADDMVGILRHVLLTPDLAGPVNATAPNPVTNAELTRTLAGVLHRPALLPVPRLGPRLLFGDLADEVLYASIRALPERALAGGYRFRHPDVGAAFRDLLGQPAVA